MFLSTEYLARAAKSREFVALVSSAILVLHLTFCFFSHKIGNQAAKSLASVWRELRNTESRNSAQQRGETAAERRTWKIESPRATVTSEAAVNIIEMTVIPKSRIRSGPRERLSKPIKGFLR